MAMQISECFIKPKYTRNEALDVVHLAHWDLFMIPIHYMQKGLLFSKPAIIPIETLVERLKDSLSTTLVDFYSLAGQLESRVDEEDRTSVIFIDCNKGPGVRFIHSTLDITKSKLLSPDYLHSMVYPMFDHNNAINLDGRNLSLLTVNLIELSDGVFLALSMNHACADGVSFLHFLTSWSQIFMGQGDHISPRKPSYNPWFLDGSGPIKFPYTRVEEYVRRAEHPPFKERTFHFTAESMAKLKAKANIECGTKNKVSSFQALAALIWRCITRARAVPNNEYTHCGFAFSNRGRLNPPLSHDYFGNAVQIGIGSCTAAELLQKSLGRAAMLLNEAVGNYNDDKVIEGVGPWMKGPRILHGASRRRHRVMFSGSPRFDVFGVDFGMGKAVAAVNGEGNKFDGQLFTSAGHEEGSVDLDVCLAPKSMSAFEVDEELIRNVFCANRSSL